MNYVLTWRDIKILCYMLALGCVGSVMVCPAILDLYVGSIMLACR